jgi:hypothetical protein
MNKPRHSRSRVATSESSLCQFPFADGRTGRMLRHHEHPSLCIFHARAERQLLESTRLGSEIGSSITGSFMTSTDINFVLGKLYIALAQNRISQRNAATSPILDSSCSIPSRGSKRNASSSTLSRPGETWREGGDLRGVVSCRWRSKGVRWGRSSRCGYGRRVCRGREEE